MPANAVTIDNYDVEFHKRYAIDQTQLDPTYVDEANLIPPHFEIPRSQSSIRTKWEELFEVNLGIHPWAGFAPPPQMHLLRNRFFSLSLSPSFDWIEEENKDKEEEKEEQLLEQYRRKIKAKQSKYLPLSLMEKDKAALLNLLEMVHTLNGFLREVHARKLQYQKG